MLLWNAEVQYVCRNAARQSHGEYIRGGSSRLRISLAGFNCTAGETI